MSQTEFDVPIVRAAVAESTYEFAQNAAAAARAHRTRSDRRVPRRPRRGSRGPATATPTRANGQPAFGCYLEDPHTPIAHAYGLMVLTLRGDRIAGLVGFADTAVFATFGLPRTLKE